MNPQHWLDETTIRENYHKIRDRINHAAVAVGRNPDKIRLVVVTKTQPIEVIQIVTEIGATDFGENYTEEAIPKIEYFSGTQKLQWHMIGHIQSRKVKEVARHFNFIHSVDSIKVAEKLNQAAGIQGKSLSAWLEFNISGEQSKFGWDISQPQNWLSLMPKIETIISLKNINILGVMAIPPYSCNPEDSRQYFRNLKIFQDFLSEHFPYYRFHELSMGMSSDFEVAIQEGSTCVRIGQAILGPRSG